MIHTLEKNKPNDTYFREKTQRKRLNEKMIVLVGPNTNLKKFKKLHILFCNELSLG